MAMATGIPGLVWVFIWIAISVIMLTVGLRLYAVGKGAVKTDTLFED